MDSTTYGDLIVDYLPAPVRLNSRYVVRSIDRPQRLSLEQLIAEPLQFDFEAIAEMLYYQRNRVVVANMYHWTDGEDLRLEDLTEGRLYFSYDASHWAGDVPRGQALFKLSCRFCSPVLLLDQAQPYEWTWERIERRLDHLQIPRDSLFHSCSRGNEPPLGFVYNARESIFHIDYIGTVGFSL